MDNNLVQDAQMSETMEDVDEDGFYALMRVDSRPEERASAGSGRESADGEYNAGHGSRGASEGISSIRDEMEEVRKKFEGMEMRRSD
jgi:hypothetical protein